MDRPRLTRAERKAWRAITASLRAHLRRKPARGTPPPEPSSPSTTPSTTPSAPAPPAAPAPASSGAPARGRLTTGAVLLSTPLASAVALAAWRGAYAMVVALVALTLVLGAVALLIRAGQGTDE